MRAGQRKEAFIAGTEATSEAYLIASTSSFPFLKGMDELAGKAKDLGIERVDSKRGEALLRNYRKALEEGRKAFEAINKRGSL